MKIFDCFMYLDEDVVLDLRLNYLNPYIDKFVIVESKFTHSGKKRKLNLSKKLLIQNFKSTRGSCCVVVIVYLLRLQPRTTSLRVAVAF